MMWTCAWFCLLGVSCYFIQGALAAGKITARGCEGKYAWLECPSGKAISVTKATYGRTSSDVCKHEKDNSTTCVQNATKAAETTSRIQALCDNRRTCSVLGVNYLFGDTCNDIYKYITVEYSCGDKVCQNAYKNDTLCDDYAFGTWAKAHGSECVNNPIWMHRNCWKSCTSCNAECTNPALDDALCDTFALQGYCSSDPIWMHSMCPKSCGSCLPNNTCGNSGGDQDCTARAANGECDSKRLRMYRHCQKACGTCVKGCYDVYDEAKSVKNCGYWAKIGECKRNPGWMLVQCTKACGMCPEIGEECANKNSTTACDQAAQQGKCSKEPESMLKDCQKSCLCFTEDKCMNSNRVDWDCDAWAANDACTANPGFMIPNCKRACNKCTTT